MHRCSYTFPHFIRNKLQFPFFHANTKQAASRTYKKMIAIRLLNSSYFTVDWCWHMRCCACTNIIPSNCILITQPNMIILIQITIIKECLGFISN